MSSNTRPRATRDVNSVVVIATWMRRVGLPLAILAWTGVALLILWLAGHVIQALLLLTFAALLAYALAPAVKLLERVMPRFLAILIVYLIALGALSALLYLIVSTAIAQFISLSDYVRVLLTPGKSGQLTPLEQTLRSFGLSQSQIAAARDQVVASIEGLAGSVVPVIEGDVLGPRIVGKTIGLHPVVSLTALIAGAELFGIAGALFASPVAGVLQALLVAIWVEWRATHPREFQRAKDDLAEKVE